MTPLWSACEALEEGGEEDGEKREKGNVARGRGAYYRGETGLREE